MKKLLILSAISLMATIGGVSFAADTGDIDLSLQLGSSAAIQTLEATPGSAFNDDVTLTSTDSNGQRKMDDQVLGSISFSGDNIPTTITNCRVTFRGKHDAGIYFYLAKGGTSTTDVVKYHLRAKIALNSTTPPAGFTSIYSTSNIQSGILANGSGLNKCDINMTELTVRSANQNLTGKNGTYTDTITYTITVI